MNAADYFETLVSDYYEPLFKFAMSLTRTEPDARDLTQQTFYTWATKGHQLRDHTKARSWLFTTMHRAYLRLRRRQSRFPSCDWEEIIALLPDHSADLTGRADSSQVLLALGKVDKIYQSAVALFYLKDCSYQEIATILRVPIGTVKSRIVRGVAQLRRIMLSEGLRFFTALGTRVPEQVPPTGSPGQMTAALKTGA